MQAEVEPLLVPLLEAGDPICKAVKQGYHTFNDSVTVLADAAMLIAQTEPMQLALVEEGGEEANHLAMRLLDGDAVVPGYISSINHLHEQVCVHACAHV